MAKNDPNILIWDANTFKNLNIIMAPGDYRKIMVQSKDYQKIAIANPFQVNLYDTKTLKFINSIRNLKEVKELNSVFILSETILLLITDDKIRIYSVKFSEVLLKESFDKSLSELALLPKMIKNPDTSMTINLLGVSQSDIFNLTMIVTDLIYQECFQEFYDTEKYFVVREDLARIEKSLTTLRSPIKTTLYQFYLKEGQSFIFIDDLNIYQ